MPPSTATLFRATRPAFRNGFFNSTSASSAQAQAQGFRASRAKFQRRWASSTSAAAEAVQQSWARRMWDSPIGLKTVHFWAPVMKWGLVIAGISDFYRPVEKLSLTQNAALTATGAIWTRWCLIIKPRNVLLATVNFFLGCVGIIQVSRILSYNYKQKKLGAKAGAKIEQAKETVEAVVKN